LNFHGSQAISLPAKGIGMRQKLLCYSFGSDEGHWEAICVDLDIAVQGMSRQDVESRLESAIFSYVEEALKEEPDVARQLLNRRSPFSVRAKLWLVTQITQYRRNKEAQSAGTFELPCPA
jgi:hypothetical protein